MTVIDEKFLVLREIQRQDIEPLYRYFQTMKDDETLSKVINLTKIKPFEKFKDFYLSKIESSADTQKTSYDILIIEYKGEAVGHHTIDPVEYGKSGIFHAHIWNPALRRLKIGSWSYPRASLLFLEKFKLEKVLYLTPKDNPKAIDLKVKLGYKILGESIANNTGLLVDGIVVVKFEADHSFLNNLISQG